jgi:hypothetical protein
MNKKYYLLLVAFLTVSIQFNVNSQDVVKIKRLSTPVEFDGRPSEEAWNKLDIFPMTMHEPVSGAEPLEKSEVMIYYDDQYIWVGARLFMQDASKILISSKKRDENSIFNDNFTITFDTYNDKENGISFLTMPTGLRTDYAVSNDARMGGGAGNAFNYDFNTFWDVKTSRDDKGWYLEMRIPFSSLKFKPQDGITTMGLIIRRVISCHNEMDTYPAIDRKYGNTANTQPSKGATIQFENIQPSNPVYVSPYVIGGFSRDWIKNTEGTEYIKKDKPDFNAGLDVKYNINSNLTLDLTANTDFAQVEADNQQVNLTRYSLYFPEKRMFFQERSSLFSFALGGRSNLFYSRNIGLSRGNPVRIFGGARIAGRIGKWDMGLLDMQTQEYNTTPSENFGVFRMRRQVINKNSFVGGIFTSRLGMDGAHNFAYGIDGIFRVFAVDYLDVKIAQTYDDKIDNKINSIDPLFFSANWERRSSKGIAYSMGYSYSGQTFKPGIGFVNMGSMQQISGTLSYGWFAKPESKIYNIEPSISASRYMRLSDGKQESLTVSPGFSIESKKGYSANIGLDYNQEGVLFNFPISDSVSVLAGDYSFTNGSLGLGTPSAKAFRVSLNLNGGEFYDGNKYGFSVSPVYNVSGSLQLTASYQYNHITFPERNKELSIHSTNAKVVYMLSTKLSASVFVQYINTTNNLISNFRLRYNPREGNDFYLVFNDYRGVNNIELVPALPDYYNRTVLIKYTHTFRL